MCNKINPKAIERAVGYFDKRNDGHSEMFSVMVAVCECGDTYWARVPNGIVWVEAEKEENRDVDESAALKLAQDIARVRPATA